MIHLSQITNNLIELDPLREENNPVNVRNVIVKILFTQDRDDETIDIVLNLTRDAIFNIRENARRKHFVITRNKNVFTIFCSFVIDTISVRPDSVLRRFDYISDVYPDVFITVYKANKEDFFDYFLQVAQKDTFQIVKPNL